MHDDPLPYGMRRPITSSFPSGHAATAFMCAGVLASGRLQGPWFALAALVAGSRVYVRMHHASDVMAGVALGLALVPVAHRFVTRRVGAARRIGEQGTVGGTGAIAAGASVGITPGGTMTRSIAITFDYRCPFAYNGNAATVAAVERASPISRCGTSRSRSTRRTSARASPRSGSATRTAGAPASGAPLRDRSARRLPGAVRRRGPRAFAARHDKGLKLGHEEVLRDAVTSAGLDADEVAEEVWSGRPLAALAAEHTEAVTRWGVWGVPTFIEGDDAAFVRFMERGRVDDLERMLELLSWSRLNEFKRPTVAR